MYSKRNIKNPLIYNTENKSYFEILCLECTYKDLEKCLGITVDQLDEIYETIGANCLLKETYIRPLTFKSFYSKQIPLELNNFDYKVKYNIMGETI